MKSWTENPIFVKFLRSQLRINVVLPAVIGVALLSMLIAFSISEKNDALSTLVTTQAVLIVIGAAITTTAVSSARESNMLDLHRITPLSPSQITVGFWLGPSVLMWLLAAVIVPFIIIRSGFHAELWGYLIALIVSGLTWQCFGLLLGLLPGLSSGLSSGAIVAAYGISALMSPLPLINMTTVAPMASLFLNGPTSTHVMGDALLPEAILPMTLLHCAVFGVIFWLIARRCIKDPISGFASKRLALGSFAVVSLLACIDIAVIDWQHQLNEAPFIINYGFVMIIQVPLAIILSAAMSVSKGNYLKGLHRFKRIPAKANPYWSSTAVNIAAIFGLCLIMALTVPIVIMSNSKYIDFTHTPLDILRVWCCLAACICYTLTIGFIKQGSDLLYGKKSTTRFVLVMFILWILPLINNMSGTNDHVIDSFTPLACFASMIANEDLLTIWPQYLIMPAFIALISGIYAYYGIRSAKQQAELQTAIISQ